MTTEVADEHSVYIESLGGRYVWDEARSCWLEVDRVRRLEHDPPHCSVDTLPGAPMASAAVAVRAAGGPALNVSQGWP